MKLSAYIALRPPSRTISVPVINFDSLEAKYKLIDTDLDGDVDTVDLTAAIRNFSNTSSTANGWAAGDLDGDGDVDTNDLTRLIGNFTSAKWEW